MFIIRRPRASDAYAGFTLVELMLVLAVAVILLALAVPGFGHLLRQNRASTIVNDYIYALRMARSEAITERIPTAVCQSDNLTTCTGKVDWVSGWLVFQDPNDRGNCTNAGDGRCDDDGGTVLLAHSPAAAGFEFLSGGNPKSNGYVSYGTAGFAMGQNSTFTLCDEHGRVEPRKVVLNITGRVRSAVGTDKADCP